MTANTRKVTKATTGDFMTRQIFSGPSFARAEDDTRRSIHNKAGGHYNIFEARHGRAMSILKEIFPDGVANPMNFVLFSTSGVHGSYSTIEHEWDERAARQKKWDEYGPDEKHEPFVTFVLVQPRLVSMTYGNVEIESQSDADFLKKLRASSWRVAQSIGKPDSDDVDTVERWSDENP